MSKNRLRFRLAVAAVCAIGLLLAVSTNLRASRPLAITFSGFVTDAAGSPSPANQPTYVVVIGRPGAPPANTNTDQNGFYSTPAPDGNEFSLGFKLTQSDVPFEWVNYLSDRNDQSISIVLPSAANTVRPREALALRKLSSVEKALSRVVLEPDLAPTFFQHVVSRENIVRSVSAIERASVRYEDARLKQTVNEKIAAIRSMLSRLQ
jgi:hypothetical protein